MCNCKKQPQPTPTPEPIKTPDQLDVVELPKEDEHND